MKYVAAVVVAKQAASHPTRGAWIEIMYSAISVHTSLSHPTRGAWIEISIDYAAGMARVVAPHTGCVD